MRPGAPGPSSFPAPPASRGYRARVELPVADPPEPLGAPEPNGHAAGPPLPLGDRVWLRGRGTTFVRRVEGPPGAPTVLLIHGWLASGGLNWFRCFDPLGEHFRVLAPDLRGHGRGIRSFRRFTLADCADDLAVLIEREACGPVIAVGYSMGGPVAQLLWRRHPELVAALGLCATGAEFVPGNRERYAFSAFMMVAAATTRIGQAAAFLPGVAAKSVFGLRPPRRPQSLERWARSEMARHDPRAALEAGHAISTFSSRGWAHEIDVPVSVLITARDRAVDPTAQARLALAIPNARASRIDDGHLACAHAEFGRHVTDLCRELRRRVAAASRPRGPGPA
jgi:3-oxoadipate enol-lactonase